MCSNCERGKHFAERPRYRAQKVGTPYEERKKHVPKMRAWCISRHCGRDPYRGFAAQSIKNPSRIEVFFCGRDPCRIFVCSNIKNQGFLSVLRIRLSRAIAVLYGKTHSKRRKWIPQDAGTRLGHQFVENASVALIDALRQRPLSRMRRCTCQKHEQH